jgi:hypothetical protein
LCAVNLLYRPSPGVCKSLAGWARQFAAFSNALATLDALTAFAIVAIASIASIVDILVLVNG